MSPRKLGAILLIVAGTLGLVYGRFSFTRDSQNASIGPIEVRVSEQRTVNVPVWAGVAAIVAGAVLLLAPKKREA